MDELSTDDVVPVSTSDLDAVTVITLRATAVPQLLVAVYFTVSAPTATACNMPVVAMVAILVVTLLHTPVPTTPLTLRVSACAMITELLPAIVPAFGSGFTVIALVVLYVPQLLVTL